MPFRSQAELRIAQALGRACVLFFANAPGRFGVHPDDRQTREPDFVVCADGKWGILEVCGDDCT